MIDSLVSRMSSRRREWAKAALAELSARPEGLPVFHWTLGVIAMAIADLVEGVLLPWRRRDDDPSVDAVSAAVGLLLIAWPLYVVAANLLNEAGVSAFENAIRSLSKEPLGLGGPLLFFLVLLLGGWLNLMSGLRSVRWENGLLSIGLRFRWRNVAVLGLAGLLLLTTLAYGVLESVDARGLG